MYDAYQPDLLTPYQFDEAASALEWALGQNKGLAPSLDAMACFMAKLMLESGRLRSVHRHNPGNIKHSSDPNFPGMLTCFGCNEVIKGKLVWFSETAELTSKNGSPVGTVYDLPPGHPQARFVANENIYAGFDHYVSFLLRARYQPAFAAAWAGNPREFSRSLKALGYYTADEAAYTKTVVALFTECRAKLNGRQHPEVEVPADYWSWQELVTEVRGEAWNRTLGAIGTPGSNLREYEEAGLVDDDNNGGGSDSNA
jgi:hypothetical protein